MDEIYPLDILSSLSLENSRDCDCVCEHDDRDCDYGGGCDHCWKYAVDWRVRMAKKMQETVNGLVFVLDGSATMFEIEIEIEIEI